MRHAMSWLGLIAIAAAVLAQESPVGTAERTLARLDSPVAEFKKKKADDWARQLPDLLPAIQKCVNDASVSVLFVVKAWPMNRGMVGVRLYAPHLRQYVCIATQDGMRLDKILPVSVHEEPQVWNPVFYPAREQPPVIECGQVERVVVAGKLFAGWLQYNPCPIEAPRLPSGQLRTARTIYSAEQIRKGSLAAPLEC